MRKIDFKCDNLGGLAEVYAIPLSSYLRIREDYTRNTKVLEVTNRDDIIAIPIIDDDTFSFSEIHKRDEGGDYFDIAIEGVIPGSAIDDDHIIETLQRGEWMVLTQDQNGVVRLSGNEDVLMSFEDTDTTGAQKRGKNQIQFKFACRSAEKSVILDMDDLLNM